nr:MAG TPA: hypothetical protein [Caudoviricetes sp.]DAV06579.1 MAG TPA: hypothetical protein [Caudoviricetes sp.]
MHGNILHSLSIFLSTKNCNRTPKCRNFIFCIAYAKYTNNSITFC